MDLERIEEKREKMVSSLVKGAYLEIMVDCCQGPKEGRGHPHAINPRESPAMSFVTGLILAFLDSFPELVSG